jgi:hypothetical protein
MLFTPLEKNPDRERSSLSGFRLKLLMLIGFIGLHSVLSFAQDIQPIPVPAQTEQTKQEVRKIAGSEMEFTYYISSQGPQEIKKFYLNRLEELGWQESFPLKDLGQIQDFKIDANLSKVFEQNLMFNKQGQTLIITFLPDEVSKDNKTHFSTSQGKIDFAAAPSIDTASPPELVAKPSKDVVPEYPGAYLLSLSETDVSLKATYYSKDEIESIAGFYKSKMPDYGWFLSEEGPVHKLNADCPSCAKEQAGVNKPLDMLFGELVFSNKNEDRCRIGFSYVLPAEEQIKSFGFTTIMVDYEQKK